ncbi:cytochrome b [Vibrio ostreicida]|uniref:Cytochrome b n=1 Tax=Vibrio ostreicida TaxID=526588 RepID=A0ABT8BYZ7_9VIBR|nr:cytochrome b [Vibrio ostreicida]MDN3611601.1 cytochrome b [Vibrio ostreicida]NPD09092.1 cytochrome b [Vibrio ostreicida]
MASEVKNYNAVARVFHWVSALVVIAMFAAGLWMVDLTYYSEWYRTAPHWHKSVGLLLAGLTVLRVIWKVTTSAPHIEGHTLEKIGARLVHLAMYLVLFVLFASGYLISTEDGRGIDVFNWFSVPGLGALFDDQADLSGDIHFYAAWSLIVMAGVHALAAIKHHVINKDNTLRKMIGASK